MKIISPIKLERYMASASIFSIVIGKLCHKKKPCPIILLKVNKNLEIDFHCNILPFDLTVFL